MRFTRFATSAVMYNRLKHLLVPRGRLPKRWTSKPGASKVPGQSRFLTRRIGMKLVLLHRRWIRINGGSAGIFLQGPQLRCARGWAHRDWQIRRISIERYQAGDPSGDSRRELEEKTG